MSIINFTVEYDALASLTDSADMGADADVVALVGTVTFTPVFVDKKPILAPGYDPRPAGLTIRPFVGVVDTDGQLKASKGGAVGVRLWANDPVLGLTDLTYKVDFNLSTTLGERVDIEGGYFEAPDGDQTINLTDVLASTGSPSVSNLNQVEVYAHEIVDSGAAGVDLMKADTALSARNAISAVGRGDLMHNVKDYGAVGDGIATDTAAIHAARDAAGVGGRLYFPRGTYKVGALSANVANQTWQLENATVKYVGPANSHGITISATGVSVVGGTLDMSSIARNPTSWQGSGIYVQADGTTIQEVTVADSATHGIYAVNVNDLTVTGCIIEDAGFYGVMAKATTSNVTMSNYLIADNRINGAEPSQELVGIYLRTDNDTQSFNRVRISNNAITLPFGPNEYFSASSAPAGILIWRGKDCVVDGNNIIGGWEGIACPYSTRLTVSSNTISSFFGIGIEISERQKNVAITGNVIDANGYGENDVSGIQTSGYGAEAPIDNVTISGNVITGFTKSAATARAIFLGSYGAINRMTIVGNTILAGGGSGQFNGITTNHTTTNLTICGNTIDCGSRSLSRGVLLQGNVHTGMTVSGNNFANCATGAFAAYVFGTGNFTDIRFVGNVARNCGAVVEGDYSSAATRFVVDSEPNLAKINDSNGKTAIELAATASALNYLKVFNAAGSNPVQIYAWSAITPDVPLVLSGQGSNGYTGIMGAGGNIIQMWPVANQVSYWRMYSAAAGQDLELNATGTNTSMNFTTYGTGVVKHNGVQLATVSGTLTTPTISTTLTLSDGANVVANTTTGSKIGTGTTQKLGFWNAAPIAQPTTAVSAATFTANAGTPVNDGSTFDGYSIGQIVKALRNSGLLA